MPQNWRGNVGFNGGYGPLPGNQIPRAPSNPYGLSQEQLMGYTDEDGTVFEPIVFRGQTEPGVMGAAQARNPYSLPYGGMPTLGRRRRLR